MTVGLVGRASVPPRSPPAWREARPLFFSETLFRIGLGINLPVPALLNRHNPSQRRLIIVRRKRTTSPGPLGHPWIAMCGAQMKTLPIPGAKNTELRLAQPDRLSSIASNTGARSPGDELITPKTSEITASRTFRQAWDKALSIGNHALVDVAIERGMDGMSDGLFEMADPEPLPRA